MTGNGLVEALYGLFNWIIGSRGDAADSAGSLHAKIADIKSTVNTNQNTLTNTINTVPQKPRSAQPASSFSTSSAQPVTAKSVTGKGTLRYIKCGTNGGAKITIDGQVFFNNSSSNSTFWLDQSGAIQTSFTTIELPFQSSLLIEVWGNSGTTQTVYWQYDKE